VPYNYIIFYLFFKIIIIILMEINEQGRIKIIFILEGLTIRCSVFTYLIMDITLPIMNT